MRLAIDRDGVHIDWSDPSLLLTAEQLEAMRFDREVVVTAGAGAGKTHTLSLRYVHLLLELCLRGTPDIESVLVLTFTEKAAAEMADRCYARLLALGRAVRAQRAELDALEGPEGRPLGAHLVLAVDRLLDRFEGARIGTFHGFCATILREYPSECGVPTRTSVADNTEAAQATAHALDNALQQLFRERPDDLPILLDAFGSRHSLMSAGRAALGRRGTLFPILQAHARGEVDLQGWLDEAPISPDQARDFVRDDALRTLGMIRRVAAPAGGPWISELVKVIDQLESTTPSSDPTEAALSAYDAYRSALQVVLTAERRVRRFDHHTVLGLKSRWPDQARYKKARAAMQVLQTRCEDWEDRARISRRLPVRADRDLLVALGSFGRWALDADAHLNRIFADDQKIDFTDMQIRAVRAVLTQPSVRDALRKRFRYLMVDEFQDTDELQWALVKALGRDGSSPSDRIFLVGDAKQAIYGFRGGDVTIFRKATATVGTMPVLLADNFRSRPELIRWFNSAFPHFLAPLDGEDAPWEAPYDPLRAGLSEPGGSVRLVLGESDDGHWESEVIARLIAAELLTPELADLARHPTPPIAILLRTRTHLQSYEAALRRAGVPFLVAQGVGFWARPEVMDLANTLHALATATPSSIVGALRSPLFCLTDQDVFDLDDIRAFGRVPIPGEAHDRLVRAYSRYRDLLAIRYRVSVSELLQILADQASWAWQLLAGAEATQAHANADRLISLAHRFDDRGAEGLLEASEAFLSLILAETRESEAVIAPTEARVVVMTVHAAKGLEFPVVVIPELHARMRPDTDPLAVGRLEDGHGRIATAVPDTDADVQRRKKPGLLNALRDVRGSEQYAEYRRLFYVAATRARDQLVLVGERPSETDDAPRQPTWAQILVPNLPPGTLVRDRSEIAQLRWPERPPAPQAVPPLAVSPIAVREPVVLSASGLDLYEACPARWYRKHHLGIPESAFRSRELARTLAAARGQVIHGVLEDEAADDEALIRSRWMGAALAEGCTPESAEALLPDLLEHLRKTSADPHIEAIHAAVGRSEVPFRVASGQVVLRGQIDRLYRQGSSWVVLDYKSEALQGSLEEAAVRHRSQLLAYGWAADRVLSARGQGRVTAGEVYFTEIGAVFRLEPWSPDDLAVVEGLLEQVAATARTPWEQIEADATRTPRPCGTCGFRGRGCRGTTGG